MSDKLKSKREQFTKSQKSKRPFVVIGLLVVLAVVVIFRFFGPGGETAVAYFGDPVTESRSYVGRVVSMTPIEPVVEDGLVKLSLAYIDEYDLVSFEMENDEGFLVPLMAYITPSGRLFVGSSMCEPCQGRTFSLAGETLLCNACRTTYDIETHAFISGATACGSYPPVNLNPSIEDGNVFIDLEDILRWRIRA